MDGLDMGYGKRWVVIGGRGWDAGGSEMAGQGLRSEGSEG